jgi:hypothetical protein
MSCRVWVVYKDEQSHHFRSKGSTRADIAQLQRSFAHAQTQGNYLRGHVTSGSPLGHAQWHMLYYYYSKKKNRSKLFRMRMHSLPVPVRVTWLMSFPVMASSSNVTSSDVIRPSGAFWPEMTLWNLTHSDRRSPERGSLGCVHAQPEVAQYPP